MHCAKSTMQKVLCYKDIVITFLVRHANISATWFNSREFTLSWRKFPNIAKYAFFVLIFLAEIFIRAIFLRFCISGGLER